MVEWREQDEAELVAWLLARREAYLTFAKRRVRSTSRDLTRFHQRFATIYAAGALAIELGVLPWSYELLGKALLGCEAAHVELVEEAHFIDDRAGPGRRPHRAPRGPRARSRPVVRRQREGLIGPDEDHHHDTCDGYVNEGQDGTLEYLFSEAKLREVCGGKAGALRAKAQLADWLVRDDARPSTRRTIWAEGTNKREQVLAIRVEAFDGAG